MIPELMNGPYTAPRTAVGLYLRDLIRGRVLVCGISDAPIQWPLSWTPYATRGMPVLCSELARAVRTETAAAVAYHWGVSRRTTWTWRKALEVPRFSAATLDRFRELGIERLIGTVRLNQQEARRRNYRSRDLWMNDDTKIRLKLLKTKISEEQIANWPKVDREKVERWLDQMPVALIAAISIERAKE
jgi:hypothetical protein